MNISDGFTDAIGNTPLIRLRHLSAETGCEILGKAEFMNPGGSVKDRAAKWIVLDAERRGLLKAGGTVVEGTAGNTGIVFRSGGIHESRRLGEGPRGKMDSVGRRTARTIESRRNGGGGHRRQHRDRP